METVAEHLIRAKKAEWIARGKAEGVAEGFAEGMAKGKAEALLKLAGLKFGGVPEARAYELRAAAASDLDHWLAALISADSLGAVFESDSTH